MVSDGGVGAEGTVAKFPKSSPSILEPTPNAHRLPLLSHLLRSPKYILVLNYCGLPSSL